MLITKRHTQNPEGFELCPKARHLIDSFEIRSQGEALELFQRAHAADPSYPLPLLGTARTEMNLAFLGVSPPSEIVPESITKCICQIRPFVPDLGSPKVPPYETE